MRKIAFVLHTLIILSLSIPTYSQTATPPSAGDGSESNPYQIATLENLYWLTQSDTVWDKHFIQIADIDASSSSGWDNDNGFTPIGNSSISFAGSYYGKGHTIDSLYFNRPSEDNIGLFGVVDTGCIIDSFGLTNINITGSYYCGGLVGSLRGGEISNCYTTGILVGNKSCGGIVGSNKGTIKTCFSIVSVTGGRYNTGGAIGANEGYILNSYARGNVKGDYYVGGLVGWSSKSLTRNCYSTGKVVGSSGSIYVGGLIGWSNWDPIYNSYWDEETSGLSRSSGGTGLTSSNMKLVTSYLSAGWDLMNETYNGTENIWGIDSTNNNGYPFLSWQGYENNVVLDCQAPISPASNIIIEDILVNSLTLKSFNKAGYGTIGYVIYINSEDNWIVPEDGTIPAADTVWQESGQQCIYLGTSNNPNKTVTGLQDNTKYYFKVYAYSECEGTKMYEQTGCIKDQNTDIVIIAPSGNGSADNPYVIENLENLAWLMNSDTAWNKHYIQTANIDASTSITWEEGKGFIPIGNSTTPFIGSYNGKGHFIDKLIINRETENNIGLFGYTSANAQIDSLGLTNMNVIGRQNVGGIIGRLEGGRLVNSYTTGLVSSSNNETSANLGGLVGYSSDSIELCFCDAEIKNIGSENITGGLIGLNNGFVNKCNFKGNLLGNDHSGGIVGYNNAEGLLIQCVCQGIIEGYNFVGGVVGQNRGEIKQSFNLGDIVGNSYIGGVVGWNYYNSEVSLCYSKGMIDGSNYAGGAVGINNSVIKNSYSSSNVNSKSEIAGGIVGINRGFVENCYNVGSVKIGGGLIGMNENGTIVSSFWNTESSGLNESDGGIGLTTSEMKDVITYLSAGWDFMDESFNGSDDYWAINPAENDGYPFLSWQGYSNTFQCQAPFNQVSNIIFGDITMNSISLNSFTEAGYGAIGYIIYINSEDIWNTPEEGIEPTADTLWHDTGQQCIYIDTLTNPNIKVTGLSDDTRYFFKVYAYNVCDEVRIFEQTGVEAQITTKVVNSPPEGNGYESNPYKIANLENLAWVMYNDSKWDAYYEQTADIDASPTKTWSNGEGFQPIGKDATYFTGNYNGNGFVIDQLNINRKDSLIGLFGIIGMDATIENLGLTNVSIQGERYVGGIAGLNYGGEINSCFTSGICEGNSSTYDWGAIGGLVGYNLGAIKYCYSDADVASKYDLVGGLTGYNDGFISCSYSAGSAKGTNYVGGLTGASYYIVYDCYSRSEVTGNNYTGGLVGHGDEFYILSSFWDTDASGQSSSYGGIGLTTDLMKKPDDYVTAAWDFMDETMNGTADIWGLNNNKNDGYPFLWWQGYTHTEEITITSSNNLKKNDKIKLFPNPVNDILHVYFGENQEGRIVISDMTGNIKFEDLISSEYLDVDMSAYKPGVYITTIYVGNEMNSYKIVKR